MRRNAWLSIPIAALAVAVIALNLSVAAKQRTDSKPVGRFTPADVLERARSLQRLSLLPASESQFAYNVSSYSNNGSPGKRWCVDCCDENRMSMGFVEWDAVTGDICVLSRTPSASVSAPNLTREEAIARTALLFRHTGLGVPQGSWQLDGSPHIVHRTWDVRVKSAASKAHLRIDVRTGQIVYLDFKRALQPGMKLASLKP